MKKKTVKQATYNFSKNPQLFTSLNISTGHLSAKDNELLTEAGEGETGNPITAYIYVYGYFVLVPEEDAGLNQHAETYGYSMAFTRIMDRARGLKCKYIQFDGVGIEYEDLEVFDW